VLVGIPAEASTTFPASTARRKGLTLKLSHRMNETYVRTMSLVERGTVDVASLVTHVFALDEVALAFRAAERRSGLKVVVVPGAQVKSNEGRAIAGPQHEG
jgi:L-iditol 2-dehydrogenase